MGLWIIFTWEGCICMREPYDSLVEFISSYNWGGGFGGIDGRGFRMFKWSQCSTGKTMVRSYGGG